MLYATEKRRAVTAILLVFMFIFAELLVAENDFSEMDDSQPQLKTVTQSSVIAETYISSQNPSLNYLSASENRIGVDSTGDQTLSLYRFSNSLNKFSDQIISAEMKLTCEIIFQEMPGVSPKFYPATIIANFAADQVSWNEIANSISWQAPGINGPNDRIDWDLPSEHNLISGNTYEFTMNITRLAQKSLELNRNSFDVVISGLGGMSQCAKDNNSTLAYRPSLIINHVAGIHGDGGSVSSNFAVDDMPLMSQSFILSADTNPTISYTQLVGSDVEYQFSLSHEFRNISDLSWIYSTLSNPFTTVMGSGQFTIPSADTMPVGNKIFYRYRSIDSSSKLSEWSQGNFLLPNFSTVNNNDGTATINLSGNDNLIDGYSLLEDTYLDSSAPTTANGELGHLTIANSQSANSITHLRLNLQLLGIHSNATIISAKMNLDKISNSATVPELSLHQYEGISWKENEATWNYGNIGNSWSEGGMDEMKYSEQSNILPDSSGDNYSIDILDSVQIATSSNQINPIGYILTGHLPGDSYSSPDVEFISFASSENISQGASAVDGPQIEIIYSWTGNSSSPQTSLIHPKNGEPVWDIVNDNLTGDTTPSFSWNSADSSLQNYVIEISNDTYFRNILVEYDSRDNNTMPNSSSNYTATQSQSLQKGGIYNWRAKSIDNDGRHGSWNHSSFFISELDSEWLGGDLFRFVLNSSIEPSSEEVPDFRYSSITSNSPNANSYGYPYMFTSKSTSIGDYNSLLGLSLANYRLPQGYAVISSNVYLDAKSISGSPEVGVWELSNHEWNEQEVTWLNFDSDNVWDSPGATGNLDRTSLLDSKVIQTTGQHMWNITSATQNSMRNGIGLDLMFEVLPGHPNTNALFYSPNTGVQNLQPQVELIFTIGSDQLPNPPSDLTPYNGEWVFTNNSSLEANDKPVIQWTPNNQTPIIGWVLELDTTSDFSSTNKRQSTSWNDIGIDVLNCTYELQSPLLIGQKWFWRVRGLSSTYQLGEWSSNFHFYVPDLEYHQIDDETYTTNYYQGSAIDGYNIPHFVDTSLLDTNSNSNPSMSSNILNVGTTSTGYNSSILINLPLPLEMQPSNASVMSAILGMESTAQSTIDLPLSVREIYRPWTSELSGQKYNSTDNWATIGGRGIGTDIGSPMDIQPSATGLIQWDITQSAQRAMANGESFISLMIYTNASPGEMVYFSSSETNTANPSLNITWKVGAQTIPLGIPQTVTPISSQIYFDLDSHAILPDLRPVFNWTLPTSVTTSFDDWIIYFDLNNTNDMEGTLIFDSRENPSLFDKNNLSFTPDQDINFSNSIRWYVQGVRGGIYGDISSKSTYFIPSNIGQELSSTDASFIIQDGSLYPPNNLPVATSDIYLDEGLPYSNIDEAGLQIGNSSFANTNSSSTTSIISFDLSQLPFPSMIEILDAELVLTATNGSGLVDISASRMLSSWDESSTWDNSSQGIQWNNPGALRGSDSELPDSITRVTSVGEYSWNVTRIVQLSIDSGSYDAAILLQPEVLYSENGAVDGHFVFSDSENLTISQRPKLIIDYRVTEQWLPPSPTIIAPFDGTTLWDLNSPNLTGPGDINFDFSSSNNNVTSWQICHGKEIRWLVCNSSNDIGSDFVWNQANQAFTYANSSLIANESGDEWQYWRLRGDQDHRIGHYTPVNKYRIPSQQSYFDGLENYSVELHRSSIFESTGYLPVVHDATTDPQSNINSGLNTTLYVGDNPLTGGSTEAYFEYDLSEIYFTQNSTPVSMLFELSVATSSGNSNPITISAFICDSFDETTILFSNTPSCYTDELTRTTYSGITGNTVTWDLTSLAQNNFLSGNQSFSFKLAATHGMNSHIQFYSSDAQSHLRPKLNLSYIDNINQIMPPGQPNLIFPSDGEIIYDRTNEIVSSAQFVDLEWSPLSGADGYKLYIGNLTETIIFDSRYDSEITGTTFNYSGFNQGEVYEWWVIGLNQSIPGPSSQRWSFGMGLPNHYFNDDGTYTYQVVDSAEIVDFSHIDVKDTMVTDAAPDNNYGGFNNMLVGTGCFTIQNSVCDGIISLDLSQLPLDISTQNIHTINLTLSVDSWDFSGGAYGLEISIYQFLSQNWNEQSLTWNSTGQNPGPIPGVDYSLPAIADGTFGISDQKLTFQIATSNLILGDTINLLIKGVPLSSNGLFDGFVSLHTSEASEQLRPKFDVTHTNVSTLNLTSSVTSYNADGTYIFDLQGFDSNGILIPNNMPNGAYIEWSTTTGIITSVGATTAELSPSTGGLQSITACYGIICTDYNLLIESGLPVQIFASLNQTSNVDSLTITADESIMISAYAVDQHGNLVTNEVINFIVSNGTISASDIFYPYSVGNQTITAEWSGATTSIQEILYVEVTPGVPTQVIMSGCEQVISADTNCLIYGTAYDQKMNLVWFDHVISYTLYAENGDVTLISSPTPNENPPQPNVVIGEYTGDLVGEWNITLTTYSNLKHIIQVDVTHGALYDFELNASKTTMTADEFLFIDSTRIDVRGNRLAVSLPIENWTSIADGTITPGLTATWGPNSQGTKSITASYQGLNDTISVFVLRGIIDDLHIIINDDFANEATISITADEQITASLIAYDAKGNQWLVDGEWSLYHPNFQDPSVLSSNFSQEVTFSPTLASSSPYAISVEHQENDIILSSNFVVYVSVGDIENFIVSGLDSNGNDYSAEDGFSVTADDYIQFQFATSDFDLNVIDDAGEVWILENLADNSITDITQLMDQNSLLWNPDLVGDYLISVYTINQRGFNLSSEFNVVVEHGTPVSLEITQSTNTQNAGDIVNLQVTGTDSDGNQFAQQVVWFENNAQAKNINSTANVGAYEFNGRTAGNYTLVAEYLTVSSTTNIEVFRLNIAANIKYNVSTDTLEQLEKLTVTVEVYDEYWNRIIVPQNARVDTTDSDGEVTYLGNGVWELETLDEGAHSATIVVGSITETFTYDVEGNLAGFFAAGGALYYVGAGLIGLIVVALLVFLVRLVRGDGEYYDDEDEEDDYSYEQDLMPAKDFTTTTISNTPVVPTPPTSPPSQQEEIAEESDNPNEEDLSWAVDYRVEDDGTEWGQTDEEIWYYRESGSDDWVEWTE